MIAENINYSSSGKNFKGFLAAPDHAKDKKLPAVLVAPAWRGLDEVAKDNARALAGLGYVGFAVDLYGNGKLAQNDDEALELMLPLFIDRKLLRQRIGAAYETIKKHPSVDPSRIGAIGFCFGGLTVIELLRSGADVRGVASFHGVLGNKMGEHTATESPAEKMKGALLIMHGNDDPMVSASDLSAVKEEFTNAGVDWQLYIYGNTLHAFTNPQANDPSHGKKFNPKAAKRAWSSMCQFFSELF